MALEMVLNEHSLCASDADEAINRIIELTEIVAEVNRTCGHKNIKFWTLKRVREYVLFSKPDSSYSVADCLRDISERGRGKPAHVLAVALFLNRPYWDEDPMPHAALPPATIDVEFIHSPTRCSHVCGLGFTYFRNALAISFPSEANWKTKSIDLVVSWSDRHLGTVITVNEKIANASDVSHVAALSTWIEQRCCIKVETGQDLWDNRNTLFPWLKYSNEVEGNFTTMNKDKVQLVYSKLSNFNTYCEKWKKRRGPWDGGKGLKGDPRPESHNVRTTPKLRQKRYFTLPCGNEEFFEWHVSITRDWRLHFFYVEDTQDIIIGYVGPHL